MLAASPGFLGAWAMPVSGSPINARARHDDMKSPRPDTSRSAAPCGRAFCAMSGRAIFIMNSSCGPTVWFKQGLPGHRPVCRQEPFVPADQRIDVGVTHPLRGVRRERRAETAAAIHDDFRVRVGNRLFEVTFQDAFAEVNGLRGLAGLPFAL